MTGIDFLYIGTWEHTHPSAVFTPRPVVSGSFGEDMKVWPSQGCVIGWQVQL